MIAITFLNTKSELVKVAKTILVILTLVVAYRQTYTTANLFNTADITYKNDVIMANKIVDRIEQKDWYDENKEYTLIFVGKYEKETMQEYLQGEIIGKSFFTFGIDDSCGISGRGNLFLEILGYHFKMPTVEEFYEANKFVKENNINSWPSDKSITLIDDNKIVVKLSNEIKE